MGKEVKGNLMAHIHVDNKQAIVAPHACTHTICLCPSLADVTWWAPTTYHVNGILVNGKTPPRTCGGFYHEVYIYISTHLLCFSFFFLYFPKGKRQPLDGIYIVGGGGGVQLSQLYHKIQLRLCHQHDPQFNQGGGQMVMLPLRESLVNWSQVWDPLSLVGKLPLCGLFGIR